MNEIVRKYRKVPVTIEALLVNDAEDVKNAVRWLEANGYPDFSQEREFEGDGPEAGYYIDPKTSELMVATLEGDMRVSMGDYLIRGVHGEFYPCKPDIFTKSYNPAPSDEEAEEVL